MGRNKIPKCYTIQIEDEGEIEVEIHKEEAEIIIKKIRNSTDSINTNMIAGVNLASKDITKIEILKEHNKMLIEYNTQLLSILEELIKNIRYK